MTKIFIKIIIFLFFSCIIGVVHWATDLVNNCTFTAWNGTEGTWSISNDIANCLNGSSVYQPWNLAVEANFKNSILTWVRNISIALAIFAVWAIIMGWATMVMSAGEEEKINKWKERVKWWILWFLAVVSAWSVIAIIVNVMYYDSPKISGWWWNYIWSSWGANNSSFQTIQIIENNNVWQTTRTELIQLINEKSELPIEHLKYNPSNASSSYYYNMTIHDKKTGKMYWADTSDEVRGIIDKIIE